MVWTQVFCFYFKIWPAQKFYSCHLRSFVSIFHLLRANCLDKDDSSSYSSNVLSFVYAPFWRPPFETLCHWENHLLLLENIYIVLFLGPKKNFIFKYNLALCCGKSTITYLDGCPKCFIYNAFRVSLQAYVTMSKGHIKCEWQQRNFSNKLHKNKNIVGIKC